MDGKIAKWKRKYKSIFKCKVDKKDIYFRQLTVDEFLYINSSGRLLDDNEIEDVIINIGVLNKENLPGGDGIYISNIASKILKASTISDEELLKRAEEVREEQENNIFKRLITGIILHIPAYKPDDLYEKNLDELVDLALMCDMIPISADKFPHKIIVDPEDQEKEGTVRPPSVTKTPMTNSPGSWDKNDIQQQAKVDASNALTKAMAQHGVKTKPIQQVINENANKGGIGDKMKKMNQFLEEKLPT